MRYFKTLLLPIALAAGLAASLPAQAQRHGHYRSGPSVHFGFVFGGPIYPYWYAPPPRYYYPAPIVAVPAPPPVYIEQGQAPAPSTSAAPDPASYWYFCKESDAYYPYVKSCPGEWQRVAPQPPPR